MYVGPVRKVPKVYEIKIGRDDKRKRFHIACVIREIQVPLPAPHLRAKISEMGFDFSFEIKADTIVKAYAEIQDLLKAGYVEEKGVSLVDLLPTMTELGTDGKGIELADRIDGRSLVQMMHGDNSGRPDDVMMEFTGEGVYAPALIIRRDGIKYVHCRTDPPMMFDLKKDPQELDNVAEDPAYADTASDLQREVDSRWDYDRLERDILQSQKRRLFVQQALLNGKWTGWDHQPFVDATRAYVRGAIDPNTTATKALRRLPFVAEVPPHNPRQGKPAIDLRPKR
jgi:choline-sulfatase